MSNATINWNLMKNRMVLAILVLVFCTFFYFCDSSVKKIKIIPYPAGYNFAFTITDDPDGGWMEQKRSVYSFLDSLGMKISIGVWVYNNKNGTGELPFYHQGISLDNKEYREYITDLKNKKFELFVHTITGGNDLRNTIVEGFQTYKEYFGEYPHHWINHWTNYDNIYWGYKRLNNPIMRWLYKAIKSDQGYGDEKGNEYFWGDYCTKHIKYVRGWATNDLNTLNVNPSMPYHNSGKEYVKYWYGCSDGANKKRFNALISKENVDKLIAEKGTAIIYTHFASGFVDKKNGLLNQETKEKLAYIASRKAGWFVPVRTIMERFLAIRAIKIIEDKNCFLIVNTGNTSVKDLSIEIYDKSGVFLNGELYKYENGKPGKIIIKEIGHRKTVIINKKSYKNKQYLTLIEKITMVVGWITSRAGY